jgi:hypothetical protein
MRRELKVKIASVPDRDNLVGELWEGDAMWAELSREGEGQLVLEIYPRTTGEPWSFRFEYVMRSLREAKARLLELPANRD